KNIDNPIFTSQQLVPGNSTFAGVPLTNATITQSLNAASARLSGMEFNVQTQFAALPSPFDGFGIGFNYTWTDGSARGVFRSPTTKSARVPLFFQSPEVGTIQLFYEKYGLTGRVVYSFREPYLDTVGADSAHDIYTDYNGQLDARGAFDISENLQIFLEGSNL